MPQGGYWLRSPQPKAPQPYEKPPIDAAANKFIETHLKPNFLKPPAEDEQWSYLIGLHTKWFGAHLYFVGIYRDPNPDAAEATYEVKFGRLTCLANHKFALSYLRHTGKYCEIESDVTIDEAFDLMRDIPVFEP